MNNGCQLNPNLSYEQISTLTEEGKQLHAIQLEIEKKKAEILTSTANTANQNEEMLSLQKKTFLNYLSQASAMEDQYIAQTTNLLQRGKRLAFKKLSLSPSFFIIYAMAEEMKKDASLWVPYVRYIRVDNELFSGSVVLFPKETEKKRLNKADIFKEMCANSNIQQVSLNDLHPKMEYGSAVKVVVMQMILACYSTSTL